MAIIKQLYNKPLLEDGNPNKLPVYPISVASAIYDKYNTDLQTLIDEGYKYLGIATPTSPEVAPTPHQNCFYLAATEGTYSQFGGVTLEKYQLGIIKFTEGTWTLDILARFYQIPATGIPFVDIESGVIPENTSDLINDSGFITNTVNNLINYYDKSSTYTKQEIQDLIGSSQGVSIKYVDTLPTASVDTLGSIYLVPAQEPKAANEKDEYITITTATGYKWETIGSTAISLDGYVTDAELTAALNDYVTISSLNTLLLNKQDKLVSGENIKTINGHSILGSGNLTIETASTPTWGTITGNIWNQSDLSTELNKAIVSVTTNEDGTIDFTKGNGDITSVDLNHTHALADLIQDSTHRTVTDAEKASWNSSKRFIATTNTTLEELSDAYNEGKTLFFLDESGDFYVFNYSGGEDFYFNCFAADENIVYYAYINSDDGWVLNEYSIPTSGDLSSYYQKPPTGIPASDLSEAVQASLDKADSSLQEETDPTVPSWAKADNPPTEVFWAKYGTTTISELETAISAGKLIVAIKDGYDYYLSKIETNRYGFTRPAYLNYSYSLFINRTTSAWSTSQTTFETTVDKSQDIASDSGSTYKYPSTKAVADYVAEKAEVFVAEYGVTTYAELEAAIGADKFVLCKYNGNVYMLNYKTVHDYRFYFIAAAYVYELRCTDADVWSNSYQGLMRSLDKVTSWQSTPDNSHFPSEKLVKDSLDAIHPVPAGGTSGQVLSKASGTDYDTEWVTPSGGSSDAVQYTPQTLTDAQKAQARVNIQTLHANFGETITPVTTGAETTQNKAQTLVGNEDDTTKYPCTKAVADALGKWGVISQTQTWTQAAEGGYGYTMSDIVEGTIPQANIDLFEAAGAVLNEETGYFELNGLTDISYEEMLDIYNAGKMIPPMNTGSAYYFSGSSIRTTIPFTTLSSSGALGRYALASMFRNTTIEVLHLAVIPESNTGIAVITSYGLEASRYLKTITDVLSLPESGTQTHIATFQNCENLESIRIKGLAANISFAQSSRLTAESVAYMINNAGTATFTITLYATAYARAIADADVQTALSNHTNVTLASA